MRLLLTLVLALCLLPTPSSAAATKTLTIMMGLGEVEWRVMRGKVFPPFERREGVKVRGLQAEARDAIYKLEAMARGGRMRVDLIAQDNMQLAPLVSKGLMEDLSSYRHLIPKEILPGLIRVGEFQGRLYFFPYRPNVQIAYYNEPKFRSYGLKPPESWEGLLGVARRLKEAEGVGRVLLHGTLDLNTTTHVFEFIRSAGGDPLVLSDEGSRRAFRFLGRLAPYLSPETRKANWNTTNKYLANESVYLARNWPFGVNVIVRDAGKREIKAYHGWRGPVRESHVLGGEVLGIPRGARHKALALAFVRYLLSKRVQELLVAEMGWPSARRDAYGRVKAWQAPYFKAVLRALEHAEPRPNVLYWATVNRTLSEAFREVVLEGKAPGPVLERYGEMLEDARR